MPGDLAFVLHAHLPFIRHPEHRYHLEENWLYEATTATYLPLLEIFRNLAKEGVPFRFSMSMSPPPSPGRPCALPQVRCGPLPGATKMGATGMAPRARTMRFGAILSLGSRLPGTRPQGGTIRRKGHAISRWRTPHRQPCGTRDWRVSLARQILRL